MMTISGQWVKNLIDNGVFYQWLLGGKRLHLQHGPIDLVIEAMGDCEMVAQAYRQAHEAFGTVLTDLVSELDSLRKPLMKRATELQGPVAKRMYQAAMPCCELDRVTPMIAVAGSVADHVLEAMLEGTALERAYVNNGGDIALWLAPGQAFTVGICENPETGAVAANVELQACDAIRGIATSGWRGRSHSLGIADAVTVLAACAADADTAATLIANAVDLPGSSHVHREPACHLSPDSDLGDRPVTVAVDTLTPEEVAKALERGRLKAEQLSEMRLVSAAYINLAGCNVVCQNESGSARQTLSAGAMHA
ncbi:MAG: UPF0280 family protein [Granulosicoccus sp.]